MEFRNSRSALLCRQNLITNVGLVNPTYKLEVLTRLCPEFDIMGTFRNLNAQYFIGKKESMLQIMDNLYKIIKR